MIQPMHAWIACLGLTFTLALFMGMCSVFCQKRRREEQGGSPAWYRWCLWEDAAGLASVFVLVAGLLWTFILGIVY